MTDLFREVPRHGLLEPKGGVSVKYVKEFFTTPVVGNVILLTLVLTTYFLCGGLK